MSASIQNSHEPWTEFYRNCGLDLNPSGIDQAEVDAIEPSVQFQESLDFVRDLSHDFTELKKVLNLDDIKKLQMYDYTAIPAGAEAAESELDSNSLFVDSSVNFDSVGPSSIDTTSVEPRGEAKDSSSVSTSFEAKIPAGITDDYSKETNNEQALSSDMPIISNKFIVIKINSKILSVIERLSRKFRGPKGQRALYFSSRVVEVFRPTRLQVDEKRSLIFNTLMDIGPFFKRICDSNNIISHRSTKTLNSSNSYECIVDIRRLFERMLVDASRAQEIIDEMDNRLAQIADRPPQIEAPISSSEEPVSAAANQGFFQSICSWFSGIFASFYNCLFGSFRSSEG